jgi:hypothetical protein
MFSPANDQPGNRHDNRPTQHVARRVNEATNQEGWNQDQEHEQGKGDKKFGYAMFCLHQI